MLAFHFFFLVTVTDTSVFFGERRFYSPAFLRMGLGDWLGERKKTRLTLATSVRTPRSNRTNLFLTDFQHIVQKKEDILVEEDNNHT
jgi:hypothetical protein